MDLIHGGWDAETWLGAEYGARKIKEAEVAAQSLKKLKLEDTEHALEEFTLFPRLPKEIRLDIWELAFEKASRFLLFYSRDIILCPTPVPGMLHTNREAREIGLAYWELSPTEEEYKELLALLEKDELGEQEQWDRVSTPKYLNFDRDIFCLKKADEVFPPRVYNDYDVKIWYFAFTADVWDGYNPDSVHYAEDGTSWRYLPYTGEWAMNILVNLQRKRANPEVEPSVQLKAIWIILNKSEDMRSPSTDFDFVWDFDRDAVIDAKNYHGYKQSEEVATANHWYYLHVPDLEYGWNSGFAQGLRIRD